MRRELLAAGAIAATLVVTGCESTQSKSARLEGNAVSSKERGLVIDEESKDVKVGKPTLLTDENGSAVAVAVENETKKPLLSLPIAIDVLDAAGKPIFRNDTPGLESSLTSVSVLRPGESLVWVNDQVLAAGEPAKVKTRAGVTKPPSVKINLKALPKTRVTPGSLREDPVSGVEATGYVYNDSKIEQRRLVVYCVARKGGKIVAAGRSVLQKVKPGRRGRYHVFFIGNPRGAELELAAPPTVLE